MKSFFVVLFVVVGSAYCRSLLAKPPALADIESLNGNPLSLVRKTRQFGYEAYGGNGGFGQGAYGQGSYGQGGYGQGGYGQGGYGQGGYGQGGFGGGGYNNYDLNPFNDTPNNYDLNPFNNYNSFGKKK